MVRIVTIGPRYAAALAQLQVDCYPTMGAGERLLEAHFLAHCRLFPEGSFVAIASEPGGERGGERVVGLGSGFLTDFDFERPQHTFQEVIAGGFYSHHDPAGRWYYGADISVHPDYRGRGVGKQLYAARKALVRRAGLRGIVAGGMLPGYAAHRGTLSVPAYVAKVVAGELHDPTLSFQLAQGFRVRGLLENYLEDPASDNWAALIVWEA